MFLSVSANAKQAFALAKEQERTQQLQFETQISQARAMEEEWKQQTVKVCFTALLCSLSL